jgi:hypothetical protein
MSNLRSTLSIFSLVAASTALTAQAAPAHNVCVPVASGVPTMQGPPKWLAAWGGTAPTSETLDDPRWLGATGQSFELGSAKAPLHTRAVWSNDGGQDYVYLSFIVDVEGLLNATATSPRDLFVGFRRPAAVGGERAYIFQFHLNGTAAAGPITPTYCARYQDCDEASGTAANFWRVFVDRGNTQVCGSNSHSGNKYDRMIGATSADPPITWMNDAVRYWKLGTSEPPLLQNRWAVQVRIPIAAAGAPLAAGVERDSTFWYEATAQVGGAGGGPYVSLGRWPRELTTPICPNTAINDFLVHEELGDPSVPCPGCSPDKFSRLTTFMGARPGDCDGGIRLRTPDIGAIFEAAPALDLSTAPLTTMFKALKAGGTPGVNTVVAQPENTTSSPITAALSARFRLAGWGAAPYSTTDPGVWKDMRKAKDGVCGAGTSPACTPITIPPGGKGAISFRWQIGDDATIGASEYCQFGLTPPVGQGTCQACSCAGSASCDLAADPGVQSTKPSGGTWPCVSKRYQHQCLLVELSAPNGAVNFESQSSWNNMNFGEMSIMQREALIDVRGLPKAPGQTTQEIYLIAMPRNMPAKLPGGTSTGNEVIAQQAFQAASRISESYRASYQALSAEERLRLAKQLEHRLPDPDAVKRDRRSRVFGERYLIVEQIRTIMAQDDYRRAGRLLDLALRALDEQVTAAAATQEVVDTVGPTAAAEVVPTLEIYAFYQPSGAGVVYMPMTSFSVFLSHQGAMTGIDWEIDGATRVGLNLYRLQIPVDHARRIQVRSQALEPGEVSQKPGDANWPCGCCGGAKCGVVAGLNNMAPTMLVGMFFFGRRRRRGDQPQGK